MSEVTQAAVAETPTTAAPPPAEAVEKLNQGTDPQQIPRPDQTEPLRVRWDYAFVLATMHAIALLALFPALFTWSGLILAVSGHFLFGMMGITIGYHRLLTHRGFACPKWFEHTLALLGLCNLQDSPARWVAIHRMHHQHSDHQPDPHSPWVTLVWGHVGWVVCQNRDLDHPMQYERYVRDLLRDPFYFKLERRASWVLVYIIHAALFTLAGAVFGYFVAGEPGRYAASWFVWAVAVRTVFVLHGTWAVNSLAHLYGYRNYETREQSRNNWLVALFSHGEGWHNNHHAEPRAAAHGHRWWEYDMSWRVIQVLEAIGIAKNVVRPKAFKKDPV